MFDFEDDYRIANIYDEEQFDIDDIGLWEDFSDAWDDKVQGFHNFLSRTFGINIRRKSPPKPKNNYSR